MNMYCMVIPYEDMQQMDTHLYESIRWRLEEVQQTYRSKRYFHGSQCVSFFLNCPVNGIML
ncbi:hypothetical protein WN55_02584 [Dufourea novaeangliae]|uniref:Uncharacterized protein n=1 Tax=Dufourea novaeangliae TaxID=178035 RepID=A0A154PJH4_DUFNO|nr:hypothetical protein WN55_02584 [Dufourea novaeangliae]